MTLAQPAAPVIATPSAPAIETVGLTKRYGAVTALDGLDLRVERGEIVGFLGPNGAGKSTAIRLLLDLIRPTAGYARVLGHDCQRDARAVRGRVGYLPGDVRLYGDRRGRDTVTLVGRLRGRPIDQRWVSELAERLDLDLDRHVGTLSKGNRQKLGLVLALLDRPPVLILDEPTSGLDPLMQQVVWSLAREQAAAGGTVFFSSHVMSEVEHTCERVAILRAGRLVAVEPVARLLGRSARLIEVTFAHAPPVDAFRLPQVREARRAGATVWLEASGALDPLLKALARYTVLDLRTEQASLEDVLLTYYRE